MRSNRGPTCKSGPKTTLTSRCVRPKSMIFATDEAAGLYLEEDLGDTTLFDAMSAARKLGCIMLGAAAACGCGNSFWSRRVLHRS